MIIGQDIKEKLKEIFTDIKPYKKIKLIFFKENLNCSSCLEMERLLNEIKDTLNFIELKVYNRHIDSEVSSLFNVKMTPALFFEDENGERKNIVIYGFPIGYEFITLIEIIKYMVGFNIELEEETLTELNNLSKISNIKVFVTPTCPYCPHAAITSAKLSLSFDKINTEIIVVNEFPNLALEYSVRGVPKIVINEKIHLEGARPESDFVKALKE